MTSLALIGNILLEVILPLTVFYQHPLPLQDVMHWYMAIQSAKLRMEKEVHPHTSENQVQ